MIILKGPTRAIFREHKLQLTPGVLPAIDRQITMMIKQLAIYQAAQGLKRLKADDIFLVDNAGELPTALSGVGAVKGTEPAIKSVCEENPSKIKGPCSRCVGLHDRVLQVAREIEVQTDEIARAIYEERLKDWA